MRGAGGAASASAAATATGAPGVQGPRPRCTVTCGRCFSAVERRRCRARGRVVTSFLALRRARPGRRCRMRHPKELGTEAWCSSGPPRRCTFKLFRDSSALNCAGASQAWKPALCAAWRGTPCAFPRSGSPFRRGQRAPLRQSGPIPASALREAPRTIRSGPRFSALQRRR